MTKPNTNPNLNPDADPDPCPGGLQHRVQVAQYAQLPLGAVKDDWVLSTADALFGRCLRAAGHLLWLEVTKCHLPAHALSAHSLARVLLRLPSVRRSVNVLAKQATEKREVTR